MPFPIHINHTQTQTNKLHKENAFTLHPPKKKKKIKQKENKCSTANGRVQKKIATLLSVVGYSVFIWNEAGRINCRRNRILNEQERFLRHFYRDESEPDSRDWHFCETGNISRGVLFERPGIRGPFRDANAR